LKPNLTLSYNSQVVDGAVLTTQASWVGMGWSLETGYIRRTIDDSDYGTYTLVVNGGSYKLLPDTDGVYHTEEEIFWRLKKNESWNEHTENTTWTVWDKEGTEYTFAYAAVGVTEELARANIEDHLVPNSSLFSDWTRPLLKDLTRPGGMYRLVGLFIPGQPNPRSIVLKKNGVTLLTLTATAGNEVEGVLTLPPDIGLGAITVATVCPTGCADAGFFLEPIMTRYRVTEKRLIDLTQNPAKEDVYQYKYNEAATNDAAHSAIVANSSNKCTDWNHSDDMCYSPAYTEFRGHSSVTEISPEGRSTTTWFHQDDERSGRSHASQTMQSTFYDDFSNLNSSNWYTYPNPSPNSVAYGSEAAVGDPAFKIYSSASDKMAWTNRLASSVGQGKAAQFQFLVDIPAAGASPRVYFYIRNGANPVSQ
jgi:hypothetical protein